MGQPSQPMGGAQADWEAAALQTGWRDRRKMGSIDSSKVTEGRHSVMHRSEPEKDLAALESMRRARMNFEERICEASVTQDDVILEGLRLESMFEFAEFYFAVRVMGFTEPDDVTILARMHNQRIVDLEKNSIALRQRRLSNRSGGQHPDFRERPG